MLDTNLSCVYTIEIIKWDNRLIASTNVIQTNNGHEWWKMTKKVESECKAEKKNGIIKDYKITRYSHNTAYHTTYSD